jgi:hypothetical protein
MTFKGCQKVPRIKARLSQGLTQKPDTESTLEAPKPNLKFIIKPLTTT